MEQIIPVFAMKGSAERAVETKNQHLGTKLTRRARYLLAALLLSLAGVGAAQAQCNQLDETSFTVNIITANTASLEIEWSMDDYNDSFNGTIALYFTNTTTSQTFRFEDNSGLFTTSNMPVGNYEWYFRGYCTGGDSTVVITGSDFNICDEGVTVTSVTVTPDCNGNGGKINISAICECDNNAVISYKLVDSGETNYVGYFDGLAGNNSYNFSISNEGNGLTVDTTIYLPDGNACDISITDYSGWNVDPLVNKFMFRDPDNPDTFYFSQQYNCTTPYEQSNFVSSYEIQYKLTTDSEWQTITSTTGQDVYIPITSKGTWMSRSRAICCEGHAGPWSDTTYSPIYFYFGPQAGSTITITPVSCDGAGGFSMPASTAEQLYFADQTNPFYYYLFDENDDLITNQMQANGSDISYNNITTPGTYRLALLFRNDSDPNSAYEAVFDTTFTVPDASSCDITATGTPSLTILDYSYEDPGTGLTGFFYRVEIPTLDGTPVSVEVQYGGESGPDPTYYDPSTGNGYVMIPINANTKDLEVKMRARCCGSFPGNIPGEWFLIDTIHHYANYTISTEGYCEHYALGGSESGSATINFNPPYNVSSNESSMGIRITPVHDQDNIVYNSIDISGGTIELPSLDEGEYRVFVYITDGLENYNNIYNAYLDTTFTIGYRFKITLQNDSSTFCATDSVLYRAIVTGGRAPYEYEWNAYETTFNIGDDSIWVNFDIASSYDPAVAVTDADGCYLEKEINFTLLPAYTQETDYYYDSYTFQRNRYIITNQLPFTLQDFTFDGSETSASHEFTFQTANGCDSIVHIDFSQKPGIALPSSGNLDTTITTGVDVYDDGGLSSAAALHADRTLTLHAPEGNTLELQLTGRTFNLGEGEALYVYDYNGVNDNALLFEYRQGMNPPNMDFTSNSRSLTFRYVTGNSCAQGFIMTVNTKDISNECLPVYNVTSTTEMTAATWVRCNMQWEYSGVADSFEVKYVGLKWNDAEAKLDTINGPVTEYTTSNSIQIGCYNNLGIENCQVSVRAICGVGDTSEACLHSFIPFSPLIIPHTGDTLVVLDSTIRTVALFDEGGVDGSYTDEADGSLTVKAADGYELVIAQSSTYDLEDNYDFLYITDDYDGSATNTYLLDTLTNEDGVIESHMYSHSDGFKFTLTSDGSQTRSGVNFTIYQVKLDQCRQSYNPKAQRRLMDITTYYEITDAGAYGSTVGDLVRVKKTNVATNAVTYDTMSLEMGDNAPVLTIEPQYTMDVQLAPLCGYSTTPVWSEPVRLSACQAPETITVGTTSNISAELTVTGSDAPQFLVSYHVSGSNRWLDTVVTSSTFTLQNLAPSSNYEVRAASICGDGDTSDFSNSITFSTDCGYRPGLAEDESYREPDAFRFDIVEVGNELSNMPSCWSRGDYEYNLRHYPYIAKDTSINADGDYSLLFWAQAPSSDEQIAILPQFDTYYGTMDKWALSFTANLRNLDIAECRTPDSAQLEIGVMTNPLDESTFTLVETIHVYNTIVDANYVVPLRNYNGSGLYPAIKMQGNQVSYAYAPYVLLKDFMVIPDLHIEAPTNLQVVPHPVQNDKALVTWDCSEMDDFPDDGFEQFKVAVTAKDNQQTYDSYEKSVVINTTPGVTYTIRVTHSKPSGRYGRTMAQTGFSTVQYTAPLYDHMQVDTIMASNGETTIEGTEQGMPFRYGEQSSSEAIYKSSEVTATTINAIAIRRKPGCNTTGSFQRITIRMADVDNESFNVQDNGNGTYTILNGHEFYTEQEQLTTNYTPNGDGWIVFELDQPYTHDPSKNLLVGFDTYPGDYADQWGGEVEFYHDHGDPSAKGLSMKTQDLSSLSEDYTYNPICRRPQMLFIQNKNCTNDSIIIDTTLCESATLTWRGDTISFSDDDIELHKVAIDSTYNYDRYEWEYTYAYIYNDKIEGVGTGGCDSIYQLRIEKRYNATNNYDMENVDYPHEVSCGPFTWRNGETYDYSMGTYVYYEYDGASPSFGYYGPRAMDTVRGVTANGCDSIYGLNLEITPYFTVIFDTSNVDAGTGMKPAYGCEGSDYELPECTMTVAHKAFRAWEWDGDWYESGDIIEADWIEDDTIYLTPVFECDVEEIATEYEEFCPNGGEYEWRGKTITMDYAVQHGRIDSIAGVYYIYVYDSVAGAVAGVCDSIYTLRLNMENRLILDEAVINQCEAQGWTWNTTYGDMNHYGSDMGWRWVDDDDDGHKEFDMSTAAIYIDPFANGECGRLSLLSLEIEDDGEDHDIDTVIFIKYKIEWGDGIDTLHSMTMYVCDGNEYFVPECPDTVTREGYDFVYWSDWPECGWEVEPGSSQYAGSGTIYLYGMWESNCEDKEAADTTVMCPNDTLSWHGFTLRGPELQIGEWDSVMTKYGVIPGECDSIYHMHVTVLSRPTLSVTSQEEPLCYGYQTGWIGVAVTDGNTPFQYAMGDSSYTAALDTTEHKFENLAAGTHTVWVKDACGVTDNVEVTITQPTEIMITNMQAYDSTACYGSSHSVNLAVDGGTSPYTYLWNSDGNHMESYLEINTNVAGTHNDTILVTDANGCTATASYTTKVYDSLSVSVSGNDTTYCHGATATPLVVTVEGGDTDSGYTYQWSNYSPIDTATGPSFTVPTSSGSSVLYDNISVTVTNACGEKTAQGPVITVLDSLRMIAQVDDTRLCFGANIGQMEVDVQGGGAFTGQWYMNGTAVTDHNPGDADNKYTPRTDTAGTFAYSLKVTSNAGCGSDSVLVKNLTVYDTLVVTATDQSATYCVGVEADTLRATIVSGSGNYSYQWRKDGSFITDATEDFYVPETSNSGDTAVYSVNVIDNNGCGDTVVTVATIVTRTAFDVTPEDQTNIYCLNSTPDTLTLAGQITGSGNYSYQWYAVTGETAEVIDTLAGATNIWYVPATNVAGDVEYRVKVTDLNCGSDTIVSLGYITVMDSIRILSSVDSLYACLGAEAGTFGVEYEGVGEIDYDWYLNGAEVYRDMVNEFMPSSDSAGVFDYYLVLRSNYGCASDSVLAGVLTVTAPIDLTVDNPVTSYCYGATAEAITITPTGGDGTYHYSWLAANNSDFMMGETLDIDTNSYTPATDTNRSYYFRVTVTSGACSASEDINGIYVMPQLKLNVTPDTNAICYGTEGNTYDLADFTEGGSAPYTYQWYKDGVELNGETGDSYMPVGTTAGTFVYSAIAIDDAGCHSDTATVGVLTVRANMAVTSTLQDTTYCNNADADSLRVTVTGGSGNHNYRWFVHDYYEDVLSTEAAYKPATDQAGTTLYDIEVTDNECGADTSFTVATIAVNYRFQVAIDDADQSNTYCLNATPLELTLEDAILGSGNYSYQWYARDVNSGELDTLTGATASTYTPATNTAGAIVYQAKVTDLTCGGDTTVSVANISVRDALTVTKSGDTALCANGTTTLSVTPNGGWGNYTYQWQKVVDSAFSVVYGAESNSYTTEQMEPGTHYYRIVVQDPCDTLFIDFTVNVSSNPDVTSNIDTTYCFGATAEAITLNPTGGDGTYTYLWVVANHDDMMPADTLDVTTNSYVPVTDSAAEYYYRVTITSGGCSSELDVARINVIEQVKINVEPDTSSICYGAEGTTYELEDFTAGGYGQYTYQWYMNGGEVFDETSSTYMPIGDAAGTFVYSAVAFDNSGCQSDTTTIAVLTVKAKMAVTSRLQDTAYCYGATADTMRVTVTGGSGNYTYEWMTNGDMASDEAFFVPSTTEVGMTEIMLNVYDDECMTDTSLTVGSSLVYEGFAWAPDASDATYCYGATVAPLAITATGAGDSYSYQWYIAGQDTNYIIEGATSRAYAPPTDSSAIGTTSYYVQVESNVCSGSGNGIVADITVYGALTVTSASSDTAYCGGSYPEELRVEADGGSGMFTYQWYMNGEPLTNSNNFAYSPNTDTVGTFVYSVKVTDGSCDDIDSIAVATITVQEDIQLTTFVDTTYCYGATAEAITLSPTGGNGEYSYLWVVANHDDMMPADTLDVTTNSYVPVTDSAAEYYYRVTITSGGCSSELDVARINVLEPIVVNLTTDTTAMCFGAEGTTYELEDFTEGGYGQYTYQWYMNGSELTGATSSSFMPLGTAAGTYVYSVVVTDEAGCHSDTTIVVVETTYDEITAPTASTDTAFYCFGTAIPQLTSGITGGSGRFYYYWYLDGEMLDEHGATLTPETEAGIYQYSVQVMDSAGCDGTTQTFQPIEIFEELRVGYNYAATAEGNDCAHTELDSIRAYPMGGSGDVTYQWYMDSVAIDGATEWFYRPSADSASYKFYHVVVTDANGCEQVNLGDGVYVSVVDSLRYSGHLEVPTTLCLGSTVTEANQIQVNTTGGAGAFYYRWYINGEPVADTATTTNVIMPSTDVAGTYSYSVKITGNVCASDSVHIMDLTVKAPTTTYDTMVVCDSLRWINDSLYAIDTNNSSIYQGITTDQTHTVADQYGCDSTVYLHLTVNPSGYFYQGRGGMAPDTMSYCYGSWIDVYTDSQYPEGFAYQWYRDGEAIADATGWRDSTLADTPGTHVYSLKVTPYSGCASDSGAVRVANIYEPFAVNTFQLDTAGCMEDTYLNLPEVDTNATGGCGTSEMRWYEIVGNDTIESNGTVYMDSVGPGEYNYVLMLIDRYECGEGIGINATVTVAEDYTASFVSDEGSIPQSDTSMADLTVCSLNPGLELPENEYVYDMHTFIGWQNTATGDTVQPGDTVMLTGNTTFNTVWRANCQNVDTVEYAEYCEGGSTTWRGMTISGLQQEYTDTVAGVVDVLCDSVYHLLVTVHYPTTSDTTMLACDSVWWNNMFFTETPDTTQSYFMAGGNQYGCDSTAYLNLTVNYSIHDYVVETACDSYTFDNVTYTESTDLPTVGAISDNGCPFITHISLTMNYSYHGEDSATACDMYVWNDMELTETGDHDYTGVTVDGCDSIVTLHLTLHQTAYGMDTQTACDSLVWIDGNTYFGDFPGNVGEITYTFEGGSMYGCDSVAVLDLTMEDHIYVEFLSDFGDGWMDEVAACVMKPLVMPECAFENAGFVFSGWLNTVGNDTVYPGDTLYLEESRTYYAIWKPLCEDVITFTDTTVCEGASLVWRGQNFSDQLFSGDYEDVVYNAIEDWCDSVFYLRLTVYPVSYNEFFDSVVGSVIWYDEEYSTSGDYSRFCGYNRYGCDSTEVLHLIVNLAIDEKEDGVIDVKVYPNPTSGIVNIDGVEIRRIAVLDQVGRTVATFDDTNRIDISDLPAGIYTLYVQTSAGDTTRRVMKR